MTRNNPAVLQAGETLAGYRIEAIAGVGGMGVVYRATQLSLERRVALKVFSATLVGDQRLRERFRLEGRHAAALNHPNIIPVYEAGESNGLMFIAMRFVDGPTLADMIMQQALSGRETLRVLEAIASALDAAHEAGLIHRDIKPHNVLLTSGGHPYLADFGITKGAETSGLTNSGDFVGSVAYVAPEQIDGRAVTRASDTYSLTAVVFHCLTGTLPYEHDTEAALMHAHLFAAPPTISGLGIDAPALDGVFARGMAKDPAARFQSATELVDACRDALKHIDLDRCPALVPRVAISADESLQKAGLPTRVFVSYARADRAIALDVANTLRVHGVDASIDSYVESGASWNEVVRRQIDEADAYVLLISPTQSEWSRFELTEVLKRAWADNTKKVLPVLLSDAEPPGFLRDQRAVRLDPWSWRGLEEILRFLTDQPRIVRSAVGQARLLERLSELEHTAAALADISESGDD
jgi:serine/threonine protein kinase